MVQIKVDRLEGDFGFEATDASGNKLRMDTSPETGGVNFGARPMQVLLMGLAGCSGIDIVMILKKQRQIIKNFSMHIEGEREAGKEPSLWQEVTIVFNLTGDIDPVKAERAVELSMNKYCSVAETLKRSGTHIEWKVNVING